MAKRKGPYRRLRELLTETQARLEAGTLTPAAAAGELQALIGTVELLELAAADRPKVAKPAPFISADHAVVRQVITPEGRWYAAYVVPVAPNDWSSYTIELEPIIAWALAEFLDGQFQTVDGVHRTPNRGEFATLMDLAGTNRDCVGYLPDAEAHGTYPRWLIEAAESRVEDFREAADQEASERQRFLRQLPGRPNELA